MSKADYYQTLGVSKTASDAEIKKAYRKLAMQHHPDRNKGDKTSEAKFKEINEAYDVLKDPQKRSAYDNYGHSAFEGGFGGAGANQGGFGGFSGDFGDMSDLFGGIFGDMMGGRGRRQPQDTGAGSDLRYDLTITLEEAYSGTSANIKFRSEVKCGNCSGKGSNNPEGVTTCPSCKGSGRMRMQQGFFVVETTCNRCGGAGKIVKDPCKTCNGSGRNIKDRTLVVNVPYGIEDGTRIRLAGEGEAGIRGAKSGDLYVFVRVKKHKFFERHGNDLYCDVPIKMTTAVLGGSIEVPTISGKMTKVDIAAGTQSGTKIRVKGCGMKQMKGHSHGDMYINMIVEMPVKLTSAQKELLQKFEEESKDDTHPQNSSFFDKVKSFWGDITK